VTRSTRYKLFQIARVGSQAIQSETNSVRSSFTQGRVSPSVSTTGAGTSADSRCSPQSASCEPERLGGFILQVGEAERLKRHLKKIARRNGQLGSPTVGHPVIRTLNLLVQDYGGRVEAVVMAGECKWLVVTQSNPYPSSQQGSTHAPTYEFGSREDAITQVLRQNGELVWRK
jgi:hypothetical protein